MPTLRPTARPLTLLALLAATGLAACGGGSSGSAASTPAQTATPAKTAAAATAGNTVAARIQGFAFAPRQIKAKVGQEIKWTNDDAAAHTVTAKSGSAFDSGTLAQGASFSFRATKAGTIEYFCAIHPSMTGTITVE